MTEGIRIGIAGLGFMGQTHLSAYKAASEAGFCNRLVAVCDQDPARRAGAAAAGGNIETGAGEDLLFDPKQVAGYETPAELFADDSVQIVSICTPTDSHVDLAIQAIEAGKHVLLEKPAALNAEALRPLVAAAAAADTLVMPAHCIRFWPAYAFLKSCIDDGRFGPAKSAVFTRLASPPAWNADFYKNTTRSGGALIDLHIHDADFVRHCFGEPQSIISTGDVHHITTLYRYPNGPGHVVAEGGWDHAPGFPFRMAFTVIFEQATLDFDLARDEPLLICRDGKATHEDVGALTGYDLEVRHMLHQVASGARETSVTIDDAYETAKLLDEERASLND